MRTPIHTQVLTRDPGSVLTLQQHDDTGNVRRFANASASIHGGQSLFQAHLRQSFCSFTVAQTRESITCASLPVLRLSVRPWKYRASIS